MYLRSLATAVPPNVYSQSSCWEAAREEDLLRTLKPRSRALLEKILVSPTSGIDRRHLALDSIPGALTRDAQRLNQDFEREAPLLAASALEAALAEADLLPSSLDALLVCTCTGYLCPGITSHVAEKLGLRSDAYLADLVGLGCGAAIPVLRAAHGFLSANPNATVATVAVEICSAAFFAADDPSVLISLCLFGDGAAAAIWSARGQPGDWQAGNFSTLHLPQEREKIRFVNSDGKLRNQLHRAVPALAAEAVSRLYRNRTADPDQILAHTGGRDVLDALEAELPFTLVESRDVLREHGNMSSPSVLFALERRLARRLPTDRRYWLTAFGAGFSVHACELAR